MSHVELVSDDAENYLNEEENENGQAEFVMEIAVGTLESGSLALGSDRSHAEAKDKDDEERRDKVEYHMDTKPLRSFEAEVAPRQEGSGESEENCYAGECSWFGIIIN
jgi:hypothetical protein